MQFNSMLYGSLKTSDTPKPGNGRGISTEAESQVPGPLVELKLDKNKSFTKKRH